MNITCKTSSMALSQSPALSPMPPEQPPSPTLTRCDGCGVESPLKGFFQPVRISFVRKKKTLCPRCRKNRRLKTHQWFFWLIALFLGAPLLLQLFFGIGQDALLSTYENLGLILLFQLLICTPVHELGHAVAARIVGIKVWRIALGTGPEQVRFQFLGFPWEIHRNLIGGIVWLSQTDSNFTRWRKLFFFVGGPGANFLLAGFSALMISSPPGWGLEALRDGINPFWCLFWCNILSGTINLIPRRFQLAATGKMINNDGLAIFNLLFRPQLADVEKNAVKQIIRARSKQSAGAQATFSGDNSKPTPESLVRVAILTQESRHAIQARDYELARKFVNQGLAIIPDSFSLLNLHGWIEFLTGNISAAKMEATKLLARPNLTTHERAFACNSLAYILAIIGDPADMPQADALSSEALTAMPWEIAFISTRGAVLVAMGRYAEGDKLLRESIPEAESLSSAAEILCFLARSAAKQGHQSKAEALLAQARKKDPQCPLLH